MIVTLLEPVGEALFLLILGAYARAVWLRIKRWVLARLAEIPRELRAPLVWTLVTAITILAASAVTTPTGLAPLDPVPVEQVPDQQKTEQWPIDPDAIHKPVTVMRI
jgi:hypothetical protein